MPERPYRAVPRVDEYFGLWAIEPSRGLAMLARATTMDFAAHLEETATPRPSAGIKGFQVAAMPMDIPNGSTDDESVDEEENAGGIAIVRISGTLMKQQSSLDESTSTVVLRKQLRDIRTNPAILGCVLLIDSPGGSVSGTAEAAAEVKALAAEKPCVAFVEDLCASAAFWIGSQAAEMYANHGTALVGSIGTFIGTYDYSGWAKEEGIKAKVYATGPLKGAGFPGAEITEEQDAYFQNIVNETQKYFAAAVSEGREMTAAQVKAVATGGVYMAEEALANGLIDGIKTWEETLARVGELIAAKGTTEETSRGTAAGATQEDRMANNATTTAPKGPESAAPASVAEDPKATLKRYVDAFGTAGTAWYLEGKSFEEATALHNAKTAEHLKALADENAKLKADNEALKARVVELRGDSQPASADLAPDPDAKGATKDPEALENKIGSNLASFARSFKLPK